MVSLSNYDQIRLVGLWCLMSRTHNNFSSVYRIFTKHGHMIPLWKGKNPIYFGVIRSRSLTINIIFDNRVFLHDNFSSVYWIFTKLGHIIPCGRGTFHISSGFGEEA
jgi:hypothetical protein